MRQSPWSLQASWSRPTGESTVSWRTSTIPSARAAARKAASSSGVTFMGPPQSANARRRGRAGCFLGRAERVGDLGVGEVVAVAEHDGGTLRGRQLVGEVL